MKKFCDALCNLPAKRAVKSEEGASLVEYGLLVALIAVVCIAAIALIGTDLAAMFNALAGHVASNTN
jgi:pilus assembly protein Flp/PilA